jgi:pimeloyl-ACP methyl ester carboxylesterase
MSNAKPMAGFLNHDAQFGLYNQPNPALAWPQGKRFDIRNGRGLLWNHGAGALADMPLNPGGGASLGSLPEPMALVEAAMTLRDPNDPAAYSGYLAPRGSATSTEAGLNAWGNYDAMVDINNGVNYLLSPQRGGACGGTKVVVMGLSMGGIQALNYAHFFAHRVAGVIIFNPVVALEKLWTNDYPAWPLNWNIQNFPTAKNYLVGDSTSIGNLIGQSFTCIQAHTGHASNEPPNPTFWQPIPAPGTAFNAHPAGPGFGTGITQAYGATYGFDQSDPNLPPAMLEVFDPYVRGHIDVPTFICCEYNDSTLGWELQQEFAANTGANFTLSTPADGRSHFGVHLQSATFISWLESLVWN